MSPEIHPFEPIFHADSRVLILGSFPSVKSRQEGFYYGHPRNRFWLVTAKVFDAPIPESIDEKTSFLLSHHLALWDVLASCEITASKDASIRCGIPNHLARILRVSDIRAIFTNGKTAHALLRQYYPTLTATCLPSTSPANAAWSEEKLIEAWRAVKNAVSQARF